MSGNPEAFVTALSLVVEDHRNNQSIMKTVVCIVCPQDKMLSHKLAKAHCIRHQAARAAFKPAISVRGARTSATTDDKMVRCSLSEQPCLSTDHQERCRSPACGLYAVCLCLFC